MADKTLKGIPVSPLTGVLDARSSADLMPQGALRMRQNLQTVGDGKLRRGTGWKKFLSRETFNNEDFHDQLLTFNPGAIRQPITLITKAESTRKVRSLFIATQSRIAQLNEYSGNWRIIGSGFGGTASTSANAPRFKSAAVGDVIAFTNDYEKPMYHELEHNAVDAPALLKTFDDLDVIGLSRARVVWAWHNCLFFADVEMDSERFAYRMLWSNFNDPTSFDPAKLESITGDKDLFTHERILAGRPGQGNTFLIYTTHGIWEMSIVGGDQSFAFRRLFNGEENKGVGVLKYPNTLVPTSSGHMYGAEDGIYIFNQYAGKPERPEWLHRSSSLLYDTLNSAACDAHIAKFTNSEVLFSTASSGATNECPDSTLRINMEYHVVDLVDAGFTALEDYQSYRVPSIRDFIIENGICTLDGLIALGYPFVAEGLPKPLPIANDGAAPLAIYSEMPYYDGYFTSEDLRYGPSYYSLCYELGGLTPDDVCRQCEGPTLLVGAASADWCLKQIGTVFYRELCLNPTAVGSNVSAGYNSSVGSYVLRGYKSLLRFSPLYTTAPGQPNVRASEFKLFYEAAPQTPASMIGLRVGISGQVRDPNVEECGIIWHQHSEQPLKCLSRKTEQQHKTSNTVPAEYAAWKFFREGRYLYFEISLDGTGGETTFSSVVADAKVKAANNY